MFKKKKGNEIEVKKTSSENDLPGSSIKTTYRETRTSSYSISTTSSRVENFSSSQTSFGGSLRDKPTVRSFLLDGGMNKLAISDKPAEKLPFLTSSTKNNVTTDAKPYVPVYPRTVYPRTASNTSATSPSYLASPSRPPAAVTTNYQRPSYSSIQPISAPLASASIKQQTDVTKNEKPLKIKVKKTGKRYDNQDSVVPTYKTSSKKRGRILIINNIKFLEEKDLRRGAEVDEKNVKELFTQMGFEIVSKRDLKSTELIASVAKFAAYSSWKSFDICAVVVMSHGNQFDGSTNIYCTDKNFVSTEVIIEQFTSKKCIGLYNIPKIFIFQCCRGYSEDTIETDATPFRPRNYADMLIAHSTVPGYASHRDPNLGTWYIQTMCKVFCEHAHDQDVESMLKIVDHQLSNLNDSKRQTSSYENRGFKRCYLHP